MKGWIVEVFANKLVLFVGVLFATALVSLAAHSQDEGSSKGSAPAQTQSAPAKSSGKKKTAVTFEDQLIEGEVKRPEFFYFLQKKQFNFGRLIKLRENFLPEMRKTSEAVQRRGGGAD